MHSEILSYQANGLRMEDKLCIDGGGRGRCPGVRAFFGKISRGAN